MPPETIRDPDELLIQAPTEAVPLSAIALLNTLLSDAAAQGASDIHLDPERENVRIRVRIDGYLQDLKPFATSMHASVLARIKILAGLRTDEHFSPQDGRFRFTTPDGYPSDIRVSIAPTYHGENVVLRILASKKEPDTLRTLGLRNSHQLVLTRALERPHGMILATGPTGSGKTTLLYALIQMLDSNTRSIVTLEDPIEYSLAGIRQIPVNAERGLTFANGLRSVLRQDPDVLMVGEIRDTETARLAVNAALTGHLVLSTLHTNGALSTLPRLFDMDIEPYLIASTVNTIVAQRLVRKICQECRIEHAPQQRVLERMRALVPEAIATETFFQGRGCEACRNTGYRGRAGLFEILMVDEVIREAILARASTDALCTIARERGMRSIALDGLEKVRKGVTTLEEVVRTIYV